MAVKEIVKIYDDKNIIEENIQFLRTPTKEVTFPLSPFIKQIIEDLVDTFKAISCVGIAANQIGYPYKIFIGATGLSEDEIMDLEKKEAELSLREDNIYDENYKIYINPEIINQNEESEIPEGCLSIPKLTIVQSRFKTVKVKYFDTNKKRYTKKFHDYEALMFQHEIDHLNGILMIQPESRLIDYSISGKDTMEKRKVSTLIRDYINLANKL